jgi:hypothetical protein
MRWVHRSIREQSIEPQPGVTCDTSLHKGQGRQVTGSGPGRMKCVRIPYCLVIISQMALKLSLSRAGRNDFPGF